MNIYALNLKYEGQMIGLRKTSHLWHRNRRKWRHHQFAAAPVNPEDKPLLLIKGGSLWDKGPEKTTLSLKKTTSPDLFRLSDVLTRNPARVIRSTGPCSPSGPAGGGALLTGSPQHLMLQPNSVVWKFTWTDWKTFQTQTEQYFKFLQMEENIFYLLVKQNKIHV